MTAATGITQTFDANGNTVTRSVGGTNWTYTWDRENRLTQASSSGATVDYVYDALGRRVERSDGTDTTEFTHDGDDVLLDDSSASGITKYQNGPGIDNKLSVKQGSVTNYFIADHLGSTNALTDSTGTITASQNYNSFGNGMNPAFPTRYQFTDRELDPTIGLQFSRARFYDPNLGRFISEDPIGFAGGDVNLYGYVWNSPLNWTDPMGLDPFKLPSHPNQLPPGWTPDTTHRNPNGSRWTSPSGNSKIEFEPGRPGQTGWKAKDHWHKWVPDPNRPGKWVKDEEHHKPGDEIEVERSWCPIKRPQLVSQPTMFEIQMQIEAAQHMEKFWGTVLIGSAIGGVIIVATPTLPVVAPFVPSLAQQRPAFGF